MLTWALLGGDHAGGNHVMAGRCRLSGYDDGAADAPLAVCTESADGWNDAPCACLAVQTCCQGEAAFAHRASDTCSGSYHWAQRLSLCEKVPQKVGLCEKNPQKRSLGAALSAAGVSEFFFLVTLEG